MSSMSNTSTPFVITCSDEGVQLNAGRRFGLVGAGFRLAGAAEVVAGLQQTFPTAVWAVVANEENDWFKQQLQLVDWEQINASMEQQVAALADRWQVTYAGNLPFADPQSLELGVRGHMVRPHGIHVANKIVLTVAGGERQYNLGCYLLSADWLQALKPKLAAEILQTEIEFLRQLAKKPLPLVVETAGELDQDLVTKNIDILKSSGFEFTVQTTE